MRFGRFDDERREYVITTPRTPLPWINYLGCEDFYGLISNTAGGYCFYRDARLRRLTRYRYNNVPTDDGGRYFYIRDGGDFWSPGWKPVRRELDRYECRHGLGYTVITGERGGIEAEALFFVPLGCDAEVHRVTLRNKGARAKRIQLFSFIEFCFWNALDDMNNLQRNLNIGEVEVDGSAIYHKTEYRERRNHYAFYWVNAPVSGFDTDRESFLGPYNGFDTPRAMAEGGSSDSLCAGWAPIASHCLEAELAPGGEKSFIFVLGYVENEEERKWESPGVIDKTRAGEMQDAFSTDKRVESALADLRSHWEGLLSHYSLEHPDPRLRRMVNIWNQYQCMVTFNLSRSASYFETGIGRGMGFRDSNQDILGFVHQVPGRARERILELAATQFEDGGAYHQYQPLTKRGNLDVGGNFNDDPLWLILAVSSYLKETGDFSILDEQVPFDNDPAKAAGLLEHLKRSFDHVVNNLGPHGLPLIGRADWNDCLNLNCFSRTPDESFQTTGNKDGRVAESVLIAGMFCYIGPEYAAICERRGLGEEAARARGLVAGMRETVMRHGWDGEWFLRAYDNAGNKVGSRECEEGRIFIEPQGFCVMAGLGLDDGRALEALDAVAAHLDTDYGIVLLQPAYTAYHPELGEITSYPPGYKENAGIFCHNNPWIMAGEAAAGRGGRAFEYYRKIAPAYLEERSEMHRTEPYVYAQMIAGRDAVRHGEAKNSWLTGTAAWNFVAISQSILGIKPDYDGLRVEPCIPRDWDGFIVNRRYRGALYRIAVRNESRSSRGRIRLIVDGRDVPGNLIPAFGDGGTHEVQVVI